MIGNNSEDPVAQEKDEIPFDLPSGQSLRNPEGLPGDAVKNY